MPVKIYFLTTIIWQTHKLRWYRWAGDNRSLTCIFESFKETWARIQSPRQLFRQYQVHSGICSNSLLLCVLSASTIEMLQNNLCISISKLYEILNSFVTADCFKRKFHLPLKIRTITSNNPNLGGNWALNFSDDFYLSFLPAARSKCDPSD